MKFSTTLSGTLLVATIALLVSCSKEAPPVAMQVPVKTMRVEQRTVPVFREWVGQTKGGTEVEIRARVEGFLDAVKYQEGTFVKKGEVMYLIDPLEYSAYLSQAKGKLAEANAILAKASQDVVRYKPLVEQNAISVQEYETAIQLEKANKASVEAAKAAVEKAQLDLGYCAIRSPLHGLAGKTEVQIGNLVGRGHNTFLTSVSTLNPIKVRFSLSERELLEYAKSDRHGSAKKIPLTLLLADMSEHPYTGHVVLADNMVDAATGTLLVEAVFPNPENVLRPGQFGKVRAEMEQRLNVVVIPQRAISELQGRPRVAVVENGKIKFQQVVLGPRVGSTYVIESGLKAGQEIVVEGLQKIREGVPVKAIQTDMSIDSMLIKR